MTKIQTLIVIIWFHIGWFGCIWFAKNDLSLFSVIIPVVGFLLLYLFKALNKKSFFYLISVSLVGIAIDSALYHLKLIHFFSYNEKMIPTWLISMWFLFSTTLLVSYKLFNNKLWLASLLGAIFGPLSYYSGQALGVLGFSNLYSLLIDSLIWAIFYNRIIYLNRRYTL